MNDQAGDLAGLTQEEADERILAWLREHDQLEKRESYRHTVGVCDRCKTRIEPRISLQWFCSMDELKKPALEAMRSGRVTFHPESQHRFAVESLETRPTGTSRGRSGGAISCRCGNARTATSLSRRRSRTRAPSAARRSSRGRPTCSTRGSRPRSGRSRRSAGPTTPRTCARSIPAISTRRRATSSASGRTG